jgi:hypothetical protein
VPIAIEAGVVKIMKTYFDDDAIVDLTALVAFQNLSSKFNSALGVSPPVEVHPNHQRHRAITRRVQTHQDAMLAALYRDRLHAFLGIARQRSNYATQSRRMTEPSRCCCQTTA